MHDDNQKVLVSSHNSSLHSRLLHLEWFLRRFPLVYSQLRALPTKSPFAPPSTPQPSAKRRKPRPPRVDEINQVEETLLVPPHLTRPLDDLQPKLRLVTPKLPVIRVAPRQRAQHAHPVHPDRLEHLAHVRQVVVRARRVEQLVRQRAQGFAVHRVSELGDDDGGAVSVPEVGEVGAEVARRGVDVGVGAIANVPAELRQGRLRHAVWVQWGGCVCVAGRVAFRGWGYDGGGVGVDGEEVGGAVDVRQVGGG